MRPPTEHQQWGATQLSEEELAVVPCNRGFGKACQLGIRNFRIHIEALHDMAESTPEDEREFRSQAGEFSDFVNGASHAGRLPGWRAIDKSLRQVVNHPACAWPLTVARTRRSS